VKGKKNIPLTLSRHAYGRSPLATKGRGKNKVKVNRWGEK
jgi:hypothetical protein